MTPRNFYIESDSVPGRALPSSHVNKTHRIQMSHETEKTLLNLIDEFNTGMLVTQHTGVLQGRPMSLADFDEQTGQITFSTSLDTEKVAEIQQNASVGVMLQSSTTYVSLNGSAVISNDRERIKSLYSPAWKIWYPEGPEQADIRLIEFTPDHGEYWDFSGSKGLKFGWQVISSLVSGKKTPDNNPKLNAETNL